MKTLAFATILALGLLATPLAAEAQQAEKAYRIGFLSGTTATASIATQEFPSGAP